MNLTRLSNLELRQICYFLKVVECNNSFTAAAEQLHIEQPPLSQRIRALEKRLNVELFNRKKRPVRLTAPGEVFLNSVKPAIVQLEQAIYQAQQASKGEVGTLSIGIASSAANSILPNLLKQFRTHYPSVLIDIKELTVEQQLHLLEQRQLDVGLEVVSPHLLDKRKLNWHLLTEESLIVVLPENHPLAIQSEIPLIDLADQPLILPSLQAFPFYQSFLEQCAKAGFKPKLLQRTTATWMLTILSLVAAGVGLAVLPSNVKALKRDGVIYREISGLTLTRQLLAIWRDDNESIVLNHWLRIMMSN